MASTVERARIEVLVEDNEDDIVLTRRALERKLPKVDGHSVLKRLRLRLNEPSPAVA